jgi:hypothetical protein
MLGMCCSARFGCVGGVYVCAVPLCGRCRPPDAHGPTGRWRIARDRWRTPEGMLPYASHATRKRLACVFLFVSDPLAIIFIYGVLLVSRLQFDAAKPFHYTDGDEGSGRVRNGHGKGDL